MKIDVRPEEPPRGLQVAAAAHARNRARKEAEDVAAADAGPPVRVEIGKRAEEPPPTYGPSTAKLNVHVANDATTGGSKVVMAAGAELKVNAHAGSLTGGGATLVLEQGARLHLNLHTNQAVASSGTTVISAGTTVKATVHLRDAGGEQRPAVAPDGDKLQAAAAPIDSRRAVERAAKAEPERKVEQEGEAEREAKRASRSENAERAVKEAARDERKQDLRVEQAEARDERQAVEKRSLRMMLLRDLVVRERAAGKPEEETRAQPREERTSSNSDE